MSNEYSTTTIKYSVPYKLRVLAELAEGLLTDAEAIVAYKLSPKLLRQWRKWRYQWIIRKYNPRTVSKPKKSTTSKRQTAEQRIRELERLLKEKDKQLQWQTLRADTLDKMVDISEEMFDISIRKKPGSKQ